MTKQHDLVDAINRLLPKLRKADLSEILLLAKAWSDNIRVVNLLQVEPLSMRSIMCQLKQINEEKKLLLNELEECKTRLNHAADARNDKDSTIRTLIKENRALKNQVFKSVGVRK